MLKRINVPKKLVKKIKLKYNYLCGYCKSIKDEKMMPLQIHHINDNPSDNREDNLIPLCISCHRKTQVYKVEFRQFFILGTPIKELKTQIYKEKYCVGNYFLAQL